MKFRVPSNASNVAGMTMLPGVSQYWWKWGRLHYRFP